MALNLKLIIRYFNLKKSPSEATTAAYGFSGYYLIICLIVLIVDFVNNTVEFSLLNITTWLILIIILVETFHKLYSKFQGVDDQTVEEDN